MQSESAYLAQKLGFDI